MQQNANPNAKPTDQHMQMQMSDRCMHTTMMEHHERNDDDERRSEWSSRRCEPGIDACSSKDDSQAQATFGTKRLYVNLRSAPELICCGMRKITHATAWDDARQSHKCRKRYVYIYSNRYDRSLQIHDNQTKKLTKKTD